MKAVVQRVSQASVSIEGEITARIGPGLVVLLGVADGDTRDDAAYLVSKIANLRIFSDEEGRFNISALDNGSQLMVVSQFTLLADTRKGRRPSFTDAASPPEATGLVDYFIEEAGHTGLEVAAGCFGAHMLVEIYNDGPVTIILDSRDRPG